MPVQQWHDSHDTVVSVAMWAVSEFRFTEPQEVVDYFEKPWRYEELYDDWRTAMAITEVGELATLAEVGLPVYLRDEDGDLWDPDKGGLIRPGCSLPTCFQPATANVDGENLCADHLVERAYSFIRLDRSLRERGETKSLWHALRVHDDDAHD